MVIYWGLSDSKSSQVSRTLLSILSVLNNDVGWLVSLRPLISKSSSPFNNPLVTVPRIPITIGISAILIFHSFFNSLARSRHLSFFFTFFQFYFVVSRNRKVRNFASSLFLLMIIRSDRLTEIRWSVCMSKSHWSLCISFSRTVSGLYIYYLFVWLNFNFLHNSQWTTLPTQSCLVLYSFCANLLHSLIMWLMVSSLWLHYIHLLFYCVLSILALIWLVLMALFCAAIRRESVSLLKFPFLSYIQVFSCEMLFISRFKRS